MGGFDELNHVRTYGRTSVIVIVIYLLILIIQTWVSKDISIIFLDEKNYLQVHMLLYVAILK